MNQAIDQSAVDRALATLRQLMLPDQTIYMIERHRSRSGNQRVVQFLIVTPNQEIATVSETIAHALLSPGTGLAGVGFDELRKGLTFHEHGPQPAQVVYQLGRGLFGNEHTFSSEWL